MAPQAARLFEQNWAVTKPSGRAETVARYRQAGEVGGAKLGMPRYPRLSHHTAGKTTLRDPDHGEAIVTMMA